MNRSICEKWWKSGSLHSAALAVAEILQAQCLPVTNVHFAQFTSFYCASLLCFLAIQAGDEVVYLREGHAQYLSNTNDKRQPPWQAVTRGRAMRGAEPCRLVAVDYVISDDGQDYTLARLTLVFNDESSPLQVWVGLDKLGGPVQGLQSDGWWRRSCVGKGWQDRPVHVLLGIKEVGVGCDGMGCRELCGEENKERKEG